MSPVLVRKKTGKCLNHLKIPQSGLRYAVYALARDGAVNQPVTE
jgi:hypothetical protein